MNKTTCQKKHLIVVLLAVSEGEFMIVMVDSMAGQAWF